LSIVPPNVEHIVEIWRRVLGDSVRCWVVFKYGTVVTSHDEVHSPEEYARNIIEEWGPVAPGTPLGDFNVEGNDSVPGWIVTYYHEAIMNYVEPEDIEEGKAFHMLVGLIGRSKRHADFEEQEIVHVECRGPSED